MAKAARVNAYELLLAAIEGGEIKPGERLIENELALRFGISRTPVREALNRLEGQGVVASTPRDGMVVAQLNYDEIVQLYFLREILEGAIASLAATHATPDDVATLREMVRADAATVNDPAQLARGNRKFHDFLHKIARNRYLIDSLSKMQTSLVLLAGTTLAASGRGKRSLDEHRQLVDAIAAGDSLAAERAARAHIRNAFKVRLEQRLADMNAAPREAR